MGDPAEADIIIINTCGFIESAKTEAIENILMACQYKQENPDLKVIVTGCLAERYKQQIIQEIPEVDAVVGIGSNAALPAIVRRVCASGAGQIESYGPKSDMQLGGARVISTPRHYAYLKIAEGCNNGCYYCAIPLIRGALRSRELNDCVAEARWLAGRGARVDPCCVGPRRLRRGLGQARRDLRVARPPAGDRGYTLDPHPLRLPGAHQ